MKVPSKFSPTFINKTFYPHYAGNTHIINYGECYDWSWFAMLCWSKDVELWSSENHAFVKVRGRFYDSAMVRGTKNWRDLKTCQDLNNRWAEPFENVNDFIYEWSDKWHFRKLEKTFRERVYCQC
jgi:hypothetical protein